MMTNHNNKQDMGKIKSYQIIYPIMQWIMSITFTNWYLLNRTYTSRCMNWIELEVVVDEEFSENQIALIGSGIPGVWGHISEPNVMKYDPAMKRKDRNYWELAVIQEHRNMASNKSIKPNSKDGRWRSITGKSGQGYLRGYEQVHF